MVRSTPARVGQNETRSTVVQQWTAALERMVQALKLLDKSKAPPDVGAQLDHAIERLKEEIAKAKIADRS